MTVGKARRRRSLERAAAAAAAACGPPPPPGELAAPPGAGDCAAAAERGVTERPAGEGARVVSLGGSVGTAWDEGSDSDGADRPPLI